MAKKNNFFDEEVAAETVEVPAQEPVAEEIEKAPETVEAEAPAEVVEPEADAVEEDLFDTEDFDDFSGYEDVEDIIAIEEAEKKRFVKRIVSFVCIGVAVVGAVAVLYKLFFGKDD